MYGRGGGPPPTFWSKFCPKIFFRREKCATKTFPKHFCMKLPVAVARGLQTGSLTMGKRVFWPSVSLLGVIFGK